MSGLTSLWLGPRWLLPIHCYSSFCFDATHGQCRSLVQSSSYSFGRATDVIDPIPRKKSGIAVSRHECRRPRLAGCTVYCEVVCARLPPAVEGGHEPHDIQFFSLLPCAPYLPPSSVDAEAEAAEEESPYRSQTLPCLPVTTSLLPCNSESSFLIHCLGDLGPWSGRQGVSTR